VGGTMPAKWIICPDKEQIEITKCLEKRGCRLKNRCAPIPYLRLICYDREWKGVTPSNAGTGARCLYLKATTDYAINPDGRAFSALGVAVHGKLGHHSYTHNVLSEEKLTDEETKGIADLLEEDEYRDSKYILEDYKTWGSFKLMKSQGIIKVDKPILDKDGNPMKYGEKAQKAGQIKTRKEIVHTGKPDFRAEEYQLNRYRILYNRHGFLISKIKLFCIVRDGGIQVASTRGIENNIYYIDIRILPDNEVLEFYRQLAKKVKDAFENKYVIKCNSWETWGGVRCERFCEVYNACQKMEGK
jgi:hypothetical protein